MRPRPIRNISANSSSKPGTLTLSMKLVASGLPYVVVVILRISSRLNTWMMSPPHRLGRDHPSRVRSPSKGHSSSETLSFICLRSVSFPRKQVSFRAESCSVGHTALYSLHVAHTMTDTDDPVSSCKLTGTPPRSNVRTLGFAASTCPTLPLDAVNMISPAVFSFPSVSFRGITAVACCPDDLVDAEIGRSARR